MYATPLTILEEDGITIKVMLGKLRVVTWKMANKNYFLQRDHQGFPKDVQVRLIDKTQASDPPKGSFTG